jgi:microcystin-dependent protein
MADAFLGEIRLFAGNFAPNGWLPCEGQLLPIQRYTALFSIIGVNYGGNGTTNFALPNLSGAVPLGQGQGPGLAMRSLGESGGAAMVTLQTDEMPPHIHRAAGLAARGDSNSPANAVWAQYSTTSRPPVQSQLYAATGDTAISPSALQPAGQGAAHNNMQPYLSLRFIICMDGQFPPRP